MIEEQEEEWEVKGKNRSTLSIVRRMYGDPETNTEEETLEGLNKKRMSLIKEFQAGNSKASWELINSRYLLNDSIAIDLMNKMAVDLSLAMKSHKFFKNQSPAEDDIQEVVTRFLETVKTTDFSSVENHGVTQYLIKIGKSCIMNYLRDTLRAANRGLGADDDWTSQQDILDVTDDLLITKSPVQPDERYEDDSMVHHLYKGVDSLPARQREVARLVLEGKSYEEIGLLLNISTGTAKQTMHQAKGNLATLLKR